MADATSLTNLYQCVHPALDAVRTNVREHWDEAFRLVYGPSAQPPKLGGKMMRPALTLLSAGAIGAPDVSRYVPMATAMEMLHLAALAHDDVVDKAVTRRGHSSLNALWDNHTAVLGGDYLVARALSVLTVYDSCPVIESALESIHEMAEGELINFGRSRVELTEEDSLRLAQKKTASLFAVSCKTPTLIQDPAYNESLHNFGMGIGTAFQLVDDLLDLAQDEETLGKPACGDLVEGKRTVPILAMLRKLAPEDVRRVEAMKGAEMTAEDRAWVRDRLAATGAQDYTETLAAGYLKDGLAALDQLPPNEYREAMTGIAEFILVRPA